MGKAFEKQEKTIEDQGKKQVHTLKDLKDNKEKQIHNADGYENKLLISKEREIFRNTYNKRLNKIEELDKKWRFIIYYRKQKNQYSFPSCRFS